MNYLVICIHEMFLETFCFRYENLKDINSVHTFQVAALRRKYAKVLVNQL